MVLGIEGVLQEPDKKKFTSFLDGDLSLTERLTSGQLIYTPASTKYREKYAAIFAIGDRTYFVTNHSFKKFTHRYLGFSEHAYFDETETAQILKVLYKILQDSRVVSSSRRREQRSIDGLRFIIEREGYARTTVKTCFRPYKNNETEKRHAA